MHEMRIRKLSKILIFCLCKLSTILFLWTIQIKATQQQKTFRYIKEEKKC